MRISIGSLWHECFGPAQFEGPERRISFQLGPDPPALVDPCVMRLNWIHTIKTFGTQCTEVRFNNFLSGGYWIYYYGSNKSTGKKTGKTHLSAMYDLKLRFEIYRFWVFNVTFQCPKLAYVVGLIKDL